MKRKFKSIYKSIYDTGYNVVDVWLNANASAMGAAVAFYTIFAIAPLLILVLALAGLLFGHQPKFMGGGHENLVPAGSTYDAGGSFRLTGLTAGDSYKVKFGLNEQSLVNSNQILHASGTFQALATNVDLRGSANARVTASVGALTAQNELFGEIQNLLGKEGSQSVQSILVAANRPKASLFATIIGFVALFIGSMSVFIQLQQALNAIWNVRPKTSGIRSFIRYRLLSLVTLLGIGFILLVSLVISAALDAVGKWMSGVVPANFIIWHVIDFVTTLAVVTLLFAMIFKMLPDVRIKWRDVWVGALLTAVLFTIGKYLLGAYLGRGSLSSAYGAAGSFVVVLMWVYYSAQILLMGAAFVRVYADRYGGCSRPGPNAEFVRNHKPH
ncbi:MAG TPA: YihY/virulence factor BrkB family protein [Verrucomicrobiae bacterium]|jgi:membrane protein|nr:YihY/virulence factor BrkB family protein [Verrucomicrobiae bacterium]